jgi:hypothetical protein
MTKEKDKKYYDSNGREEHDSMLGSVVDPSSEWHTKHHSVIGCSFRPGRSEKCKLDMQIP